MGLLELVDPVEDRVDLVDGVVRVASDLELDQGCVPVCGNLAVRARLERRATFWTSSRLEMPETTSSIAEVKAGSVALSVPL